MNRINDYGIYLCEVDKKLYLGEVSFSFSPMHGIVYVYVGGTMVLQAQDIQTEDEARIEAIHLMSQFLQMQPAKRLWEIYYALAQRVSSLVKSQPCSFTKEERVEDITVNATLITGIENMKANVTIEYELD